MIIWVLKFSDMILYVPSWAQLSCLHFQTYDLETENLKILMEKLRAVSGTLQSFIISRRKATPTAQRTSGDLLYSVIDLLQITKAIFSWLNRYPCKLKL